MSKMNNTFIIKCLVFTLVYGRTVNAAAKQCFMCSKKCKDPFEVQKCTGSDPQNYICFTIKYKSGNETSKGCIDEKGDEDLHIKCKAAEKAGGMCVLCSTQLCNSAEIDSFSVISFLGAFVLVNVL